MIAVTIPSQESFGKNKNKMGRQKRMQNVFQKEWGEQVQK